MEHPWPLMIVDDEPLARTALSNLLVNRFPDFKIVGEAASGPEGLELFRERRPSVVVMDIQIPGFNGLEASRMILNEAPDTQVIVLSAYDDFAYAQDALHDGVLGYLLKPIREDKLRDMLRKAVSKLKNIIGREKVLHQFRALKTIARREQVASFIYGSRGGISAEQFAVLSEPHIESGYFIIFRLDDTVVLSEDMTLEVIRRLDRMTDCLPGDWLGNHLPVFFRSDKVGEDDWRSEAEFLSREIRYIFKDVTKNDARAGVGPIRTSPDSFSESFHIAFDVLENRNESAAVRFSSKKEHVYPVEEESAFLEACRSSSGQKALDTAKQLSDKLISPSSSIMDARFAVTEFLIMFRREWERFGGTAQRRSMANYYREALLCTDHSVLRDWFLLVVRDLIHNLVELDAGDDFILRKVRHFIDLNPLKNVSLETTADALGLTASYLSRLFKDKTGRNFHDYVLDRRMDNAASLLKESTIPVGEIASEVGYGDVAYFSKIFKKRFGSSPREYRQDPR